jgi:hypothetical protein
VKTSNPTRYPGIPFFIGWISTRVIMLLERLDRKFTMTSSRYEPRTFGLVA